MRLTKALLTNNTLHPFAGIFQHFHQLALPALRLRPQLAHILPPRRLRQTHQDALNPRSRCRESELGATVVHEIELDVSPPAYELPAPLRRRIRRANSTLEDRDIRWDKRVARGRVRATAVDIGDEESAAIGGRARENADLLEDDLSSGV